MGRYATFEHRSVPQIHQQLQQRGVCISQRSVSELLARYDELLAVSLNNSERLKALVKQHLKAILAIDGMQPDVGHEVLWVIRECLSGEILLTRTLLSAKNQDLAALLAEVKTTLEVPIIAVVSDGQQSIRARSRGSIAWSGTLVMSFPLFALLLQKKFIRQTVMPKRN